MSYQDYVYFMLSEEDRGNAQSLKYWFTCVDLDGDGRIGHTEMRYFYDMQAHRMESLGHEVVAYGDMVCQIWDMLRVSAARSYVTLADFLRPEILKVGGVFFDCLFNLNKFIGFEQRDPFLERQKRADPFDADWDRFAFHDYNRLAAEDEREGGSADMDASDEWGIVDDDRQITAEAPF
jgi:serine/threonine-protein phosphatase 2A regulatory subunit B''|eukprot:7586-Heterococcus_DN1.PRE.1